MSPVFWNDDPDQFDALVSEVVNALQASLNRSALVRREAQQTADDAVLLEGQIARAVTAVKRLREGGTR
jgi:hypothetical protein